MNHAIIFEREKKTLTRSWGRSEQKKESPLITDSIKTIIALFEISDWNYIVFGFDTSDALLFAVGCC